MKKFHFPKTGQDGPRVGKNHVSFYIYIFFFITRAYFRLLLGATFAPNLAPWFLEKLSSLEMVKSDFCLWGASKQNDPFSENVPQNIAPMPPMSRIGPDYLFLDLVLNESSFYQLFACTNPTSGKILALQL